MKRGDIGAVEEVLSRDPRGDAEEYELVEAANAAFSRIKAELSSQRKATKELQAKYDELLRMTCGYVARLHEGGSPAPEELGRTFVAVALASYEAASLKSGLRKFHAREFATILQDRVANLTKPEAS